MSDLNLDLNLNHYNIIELQQILELKDNYTFEDIQIASINVKNKIFKVTTLDEFKKNEIDRFLTDTVSRLERNFINNSLSLIDNKINNILIILQNDKKKDE
tara:strand:+ start:165 stop:467 length:303 start_codon:yes stop_codon:yes gene_type:complete